MNFHLEKPGHDGNGVTSEYKLVQVEENSSRGQ